MTIQRGGWRRGIWALPVLMGLLLLSCSESPEVKSAKYLAAGKKLLQKKDAARAVLQFRNALKATPDNPEIYYQLGEAYGLAKDFPAAIVQYRKALELDPKHPGARLRLAEMMAAARDAQSVRDAAAALRDLLKNNAANTEILNTLAYADLRLGNIDSAVSSLDRVLSESPGELGASALMAGARLLNHDPKGAEEVLIKACREAPRSAEARRVLGDFYVEQKRLGEAETQFRAALAIDPKNGPALLDFARLQVAENREQDADQSFQRLAKVETYRSIHAIFLFQKGRRDDAIRELEK